MTRATLVPALFLALLLPPPGGPRATPAPAAAETLDRLCRDYWEFRLRTDPIQATYLGIRRYDAKLPRIDAQARARQRRALTRFQARLGVLDRAGLDERDLVTAEVLELELRRRLEGMRFRFHQWRIDQMRGPQVWLFELVNAHPLDAEGRESFLARLERFPGYMDAYLDNLRQGMQTGNVAPRVAVRRVIAQLRAILETPPPKCPLLKAVEKVEDARARPAFRRAVRAAVRTRVYPAYRKLLRYLDRVYLARARDVVGLGATPAGPEAYRHQIWAHTSLPLSARELHATGARVLGELQERMVAIARTMGHEGDLKSFLVRLRSEPGHFYATPEEVVRDAEANLSRAREILPRFFRRLPKKDVRVRAIEAYREADAPAAYYYQPRGDDPFGTYYINTHRPDQRPRYNMPALTIHEAVPGHHFQIALARELTDLPAFRRHEGVTAFVEGWALYSELLGEETGFYRTDLERFGMLTYQAWRAARLVVDTGMHAMGWSRERAVAFMLDNVALSRVNAENEIDRYIIWPGQALAYMVGRLKIQELRGKAAAALGDRFDVRAFHDEVLRHGGIPLTVLERVIDRWIAGVQQEHGL